jgi:hypothetical protein
MIIKAILKINPNAKATVIDDDINQITWHNGTTPIPKADIEAKMVEIANEPEQSAYVEQRRNAYPEIGDQLDMLWHTMDRDNELQHKFYDFYQTIKKVKVAFPKK